MHPQGAVVTATDPFGNSGERPYLLLSNDRHPFRDEESIGVVVTTTARPEAVELATEDFRRGSLPRQSYVSPWNPVTLKDYAIDKRVATVLESVVATVVEELNGYVEPPDASDAIP